MRPMSETNRNSRRLPIAAAAIFIFLSALVIRLYKLGGPGFSLDEMVSLELATTADLRNLFWDANPPLYYLLLRPWVALTGESEFFVRLFSALVSSIGATWMFIRGSRLLPRAAAFAAAAFLVLSPASVLAAQDARMYALMETLVAVALLLSLAKPQRLIPLAMSFVALAFTHFFSLLFIGADLLVLLLGPQARKGLRWLAALGGLAGVASIALMFTHGFQRTEPLSWQNLRYAARPLSLDLAEVFVGAAGSLFTAALLVLVFGIGSFLSPSNLRKNPAVRICGLCLLTVFAVMGLSEMMGRSLLIPRYFIFLTPPVALAFAAALREISLRSRALAVGLAMLTLGGQAVVLPQAMTAPKARWREAMVSIAESPNPVVFTTRTLMMRTPYLRDRHIEVRPWVPGQDGLMTVQSALREGHRVWLLENFWGQVTYWQDLEERLRHAGLVTRVRVFDGAPDDPIFTLEITSE